MATPCRAVFNAFHGRRALNPARRLWEGLKTAQRVTWLRIGCNHYVLALILAALVGGVVYFRDIAVGDGIMDLPAAEELGELPAGKPPHLTAPRDPPDNRYARRPPGHASTLSGCTGEAPQIGVPYGRVIPPRGFPTNHLPSWRQTVLTFSDLPMKTGGAPLNLEK